MTNLLLGLDLGEKKTGLAICEANRISIPNLLKTVKTKLLIEELKAIIRQKKKQDQFVKALVIGLPLNMDNTESKFTQRVREYSEEIKAGLANILIFYEEEKLTSWDAREILMEQGCCYRKIKKFEDQMAAKIILNSFMKRNEEKIPDLF